MLRMYGAIPLLPLCLRNVHMDSFTFTFVVLDKAQWPAYRTGSLYTPCDLGNSSVPNTVDPRMNGLTRGVGGPVMPIVRYFRIMCI